MRRPPVVDPELCLLLSPVLMLWLVPPENEACLGATTDCRGVFSTASRLMVEVVGSAPSCDFFENTRNGVVYMFMPRPGTAKLAPLNGLYLSINSELCGGDM
jgi:hypothetical protein